MRIYYKDSALKIGRAFALLLYPMSVQSVKKRNGCTLATAQKKFQHTLAGAEKRKVTSLAGAE